MSIEQEKRMAGDYAIIHAFHIGDREIVLGENPAAERNERYMCAFCDNNGLMAGYTEVMFSDDYAWKLVATDKTPAGKRDDVSLREKEDKVE